MCEGLNRVHFSLFCKTFTSHILTFICLEGAQLENNVTVIVSCYDVVSPIPDCCNSGKIECYCAEKFLRIFILVLILVRHEEIAYD